MDRIKRISNEVMNEYSERFGTDFLSNKQSLNEISIVRSKGLKNKIAGYITKMLQRQAKFEERKQMIIENEKKSQETKNSRSKKQIETYDESKVKVESTQESVESTQESVESTQESVESTQESVESTQESVKSEEKTIAEEIVDESKSE